MNVTCYNFFKFHIIIRFCDVKIRFLIMNDKIAKQLQNISSEIFMTEQTYNGYLQEINAVVGIKLRDIVSNGEINIPSEIPSLFEKLEQIKNVSDTLMSKLFEATQSANANISIGRCFDDISDIMKYYLSFIKEYQTASTILTKERVKNAHLNSFLCKCEPQLRDTIDAYLIMPVQRPPRYRLLLKELLKYTPEECEDHKVIKNAFEKVSDEILKVDNSISEFEEAVKKSELQAKLKEFDFFGLGVRLLFSGQVTKFSRKDTDERWLILFQHELLVAQNGIMPHTLKKNKEYNSGEYLVSPVDDNEPFKFAVDIRQKTKSFRCNFESLKSKNDFLENFQNMLESKNIDKHDLEMKGFAPVWIPDNQAPLCMSCKVKFTIIFRRHHCRYCGDCICKNCFNNKIELPGISKEPQSVCPKCYLHIQELLGIRGKNLSVASLISDIQQPIQHKEPEQQQQQQQQPQPQTREFDPYVDNPFPEEEESNTFHPKLISSSPYNF